MALEPGTGLFTVEALTEPGNALARQYLGEYGLHLEAMRTGLLAIARGAAGDSLAQTLQRVLRAVHAVRGAGFLGLARIGELAQQIEDELTLFRSRAIALKPHQIRVLLLATDRLGELVRDPDASNQADISAITANLARLHADCNIPDEQCHSAAARRARGQNSLRILVGEDDASSLLLIRTFLSRYGECDAVSNGAEAVEAFRAALERGHAYDLLCLDVRMPEMDGPEALRQVRALEEERGIYSACGARIVMMTAVDDARELIRCFQEFTDAYMRKPVNLAGLLRQLRSWELI